jgi:2-polyprenyl-6-methoxyphenol hydroxylase-like FAD-dependent oxidoreductase
MDTIHAQVCVAGGGPAGVMLGLLLAREGIDVVVLEKHDDFFRDFRGDTVHPSTLNIIDALGLRAAFDAIPHKPLHHLDAVIDGLRIHAVNLATLPPPNDLITLMPQWDLLTLLADEGRRHPSFTLLMGADVTDVVRTGGRVRGVHARTAAGDLQVTADLVVAADGRASTVRDALQLEPVSHGVPIDVLWFRVAAPDHPLPDTLAWISMGSMIVTIPRPGYFQCGMLVPKGSFDDIRAGGIEAFRERFARVVPPLRPVVDAVESFDDVKLLSVELNHLRRWWVPGALLIGDAAHAMSPAFGVGINYAIQDAVATARLILPALRSGARPDAVDRACAAVQRRRARPTLLMQQIQRVVHRLISRPPRRILHNPPTGRERVVLRAVVPVVQRLLPRLAGYGFRPERIASRGG